MAKPSLSGMDSRFFVVNVITKKKRETGLGGLKLQPFLLDRWIHVSPLSSWNLRERVGSRYECDKNILISVLSAFRLNGAWITLTCVEVFLVARRLRKASLGPSND